MPWGGGQIWPAGLLRGFRAYRRFCHRGTVAGVAKGRASLTEGAPPVRPDGRVARSRPGHAFVSGRARRRTRGPLLEKTADGRNDDDSAPVLGGFWPRLATYFGVPSLWVSPELCGMGRSVYVAVKTRDGVLAHQAGRRPILGLFGESRPFVMVCLWHILGTRPTAASAGDAPGRHAYLDRLPRNHSMV